MATYNKRITDKGGRKQRERRNKTSKNDVAGNTAIAVLLSRVERIMIDKKKKKEKNETTGQEMDSLEGKNEGEDCEVEDGKARKKQRREQPTTGILWRRLNNRWIRRRRMTRTIVKGKRIRIVVIVLDSRR